MLAAEYQTVRPDEKLIAGELERSRRELENGRLLADLNDNHISFTAERNRDD